jgi:glutamate/aspartate transport system substrate-binding protein
MKAFIFALALIAPITAFAQSDTLEKIKSSGVITIGHRESAPPFSFVDANNNVSGYSIDVCNQVVEGLKKQLSLPDLKVRYLPVSSQTRIPLLGNGTVDMECGITTITLGRRQQVEFSQPIFSTETRFAIKKGSGIKKLADLNGKTVGSGQGTTDERIVRDLAAKHGIKDLRLVNFGDQAQGVLALETDRLDAFFADDVVLYSLISKSRNKESLEVVGPSFGVSPYAIMLRRDDPDFKLAVDRALAEFFRSDEVVGVFEKWFKPIDIPLSPQLQTLFKLGAIQE